MKPILSVICALVLVFLFTPAQQVSGRTISVPDDYPTIQSGIDAAMDGDILLVAPGTYYENIDFLGKSVTLWSEEGADETIIDGNQNGSVVRFASGETGQAIIDGFSIRNGYTDVTGGGIYCEGSSPTIQYCTISGNVANYGGGIGCISSSPTIRRSTITGNEAYNDGGGVICLDYSSPYIMTSTISENVADSYGGGIACRTSSPTIINVSIAENSAFYGGGIGCLEYANPTIMDNSTITDNEAVKGGGIGCRDHSSPSVTNTTISMNSATYYGGGVWCLDYSSPLIKTCTISLNTADSGGGIGCYSNSSPSITNCTITGNTVANHGGGVICWDSSSPTIMNCTISENVADYYGGGVWSYLSYPKIRNSTISANRASHGGGIGAHHSPQTITNCSITENRAVRSGGGGIYCLNSASTIENNRIEGNAASTWGGGIYCSASSPSITNCEIIDNSATWAGGGISSRDYSSPTIRNCTIADNNADLSGGGIESSLYSSPMISNAIMWGDFAPEGLEIRVADDSALTVTYSNIQGGETGIALGKGGALAWESRNIDVDPEFVGEGNFQLSGGSPCIDAGDPNAVYDDLCFPPSLNTEVNDMGAFGGPTACGSCDLDYDGHFDEACGGDDCDDAVSSVFLGAVETCDGFDNDCDGLLLAEEVDADGDGWMVCKGDCDDTDAFVFPWAVEECDFVDNDCDGGVDEGFDLDRDGWTSCDGDCEDTLFSVNPGGEEVCGNGIDDECDGLTDGDDPDCGGAATGGGCGCALFGTECAGIPQLAITGLVTLLPLGFILLLRRPFRKGRRPC